MFSHTLHFLFAGALLIHGIGHTIGFTMPARSWLFKNINGFSARVTSSIFWSLSMVCFIAATLSYMGILLPGDGWLSLSFLAACISLTGLILFGKNWSLFNFMGALTMNLAIIMLVILQVII
jgi:hypothetical protein